MLCELFYQQKVLYQASKHSLVLRQCKKFNSFFFFFFLFEKWIEEFLPPDDYKGYAEVKKRVSTTLLTTGEHEYTRYGFRQLIDRQCCDLLQPGKKNIFLSFVHNIFYPQMETSHERPFYAPASTKIKRTKNTYRY